MPGKKLATRGCFLVVVFYAFPGILAFVKLHDDLLWALTRHDDSIMFILSSLIAGRHVSFCVRDSNQFGICFFVSRCDGGLASHRSRFAECACEEFSCQSHKKLNFNFEKCNNVMIPFGFTPSEVKVFTVKSMNQVTRET